MSSPSTLTLEALRQAVRVAEPAALLVEPRILRRVIRLDRRLMGLGFSVPHRKTYTIERDRLLAFVDLEELDLSPAAELPRHVILLSKPADDESLEYLPAEDSLHRYWKMLFHARVHVDLGLRFNAHPTPQELAGQRRQEIGEVEFAEIQAVLLKDKYLFPEPSDLETYVEFVSVYLELRYFSESDLPLWFPAIRDWAEIDRIVSLDIAHLEVFERTRLGTKPLEAATGSSAGTDRERHTPQPRRWAFLGRLGDPAVRARRAAAVGNGVKAAILQTRAAQLATGEQRRELTRGADHELRRVVLRLQPVLQFSESDVDLWCRALQPLLGPAAAGFWTLEARLLYDLQKVCVEHERGVFKLDPISWICTLGRRPLRRPLNLLREVLITKHLRSAARRVATARLSEVERRQVESLLAATVEQVEHRSRDRIRPLILDVLTDVGLVPQNIPERVARQAVVEELLDRIVEYGVVNLGNLRDSLSKNDLKLPDLAGVTELLGGDRLLRADRQLGAVLDGVYRPGAVYLRWAQRLSSLAFGTRPGRFATKYMLLPYGGTYLALAFLRHLILGDQAANHGSPPETPLETISAETGVPPAMQIGFAGAVFLFGTWVALLMHNARFRAWFLSRLTAGWQILRRVVVDWPTAVFRSPLVHRILRSTIYAAVRDYIVRPAVLTALIGVAWALVLRSLHTHVVIETFLLTALILNSPAGRFADEWIADLVVRAWHDLRMRVFAVTYQVIMDGFHALLVGLERIVYTVDEWVRFRAGDHRGLQLAKLVGGTLWFFVSYVVVFVFTLLLEPQINPIKHFPVVTVAHKLLLPAAPELINGLARYDYIGLARANAIVWSTIWLIPGVFGFLVWELKGNWQLYKANRPGKLLPAPFGHHGETMVRLLRTGFHSGTLPKLFAALRSASRKAQQSGDRKAVNRKRAAVERVEEAVGNFVTRDLTGLLNAATSVPASNLVVSSVGAATNRLKVTLQDPAAPEEPVVLIWEETGGQLTVSVAPTCWLEHLNDQQRERFAMALAGLFQRSGADAAQGPLDIPLTPPLTWQQWLETWAGDSRVCDRTIKVESRIATAAAE